MYIDPAIGMEHSDNEDSVPASAIPRDLAPPLDSLEKNSGNQSNNPGVGLEFSNDEWPHLLEFSDDEDLAANIGLANKELSVAGNVQSQDPSVGMELSNNEDVAVSMELSDDEDVAAGMEILDSE
ncbi:hypothetical protein DXG01_004106 [Tephrocybe rancida]|nr:hypothetical protein DXG01_004106 [Tephrocybe rancida]